MMHIGWPQGIVLAVFALRVMVHAVKDGQPKDPDQYRFGVTVVTVAINMGLLYWGGFFG